MIDLSSWIFPEDVPYLARIANGEDPVKVSEEREIWRVTEGPDALIAMAKRCAELKAELDALRKRPKND